VQKVVGSIVLFFCLIIFVCLILLFNSTGGHNVILEIQATLPSPPPTLKPYMRGKFPGARAGIVVVV